jgi:hypothetical protein
MNWKVTVMTYFKVLFQSCLEELGKTTKTCQDSLYLDRDLNWGPPKDKALSVLTTRL